MIPNIHLLANEGRAGVLLLTTGEQSNYGSICIVNNYAIYWTGKGLYDVFPPSPSEAQQKLAKELRKKFDDNKIEELIASHHIAITPLNKIMAIIN